MNYPLEPIAVIRTPFKEKFATPRQPGLTPSVHALIDFYPGFATPQAVRGLEGFSHLWLIFSVSPELAEGLETDRSPPSIGRKSKGRGLCFQIPF